MENLNLNVKPKLEVKPILIKDIKYDDKMFVPIGTGSEMLDEFLSHKGGVMPSTNIIVIGDPGVGKSTICLDFMCEIQLFDQTKRVGFLSGEMSKIDMYEYCERYPKFKLLPSIFFEDYLEFNPQEVVENFLDEGWDVVCFDSLAEILALVQSYNKWTSTQAENWLLGLLKRHNDGGNKRKLYTSFLLIQQVTKGGQFVGSNRLKHMTTGMIEARFDKESNYRYICFTKNRRGEVHKKMNFVLSDQYVTYTYSQTDLAGIVI